MGYQRKPTIYRLTFPDDYPDLEVFAKSVSVEEYLAVAKLADAMQASPDEGQVKDLVGWFAKRLVKWNLEDEDGKPVPATTRGLMSEELPFVFKLVTSWVSKVVGVDAPLRRASGPGVTAPDPMEASMPMTPMTPAGTGSPPS